MDEHEMPYFKDLNQFAEGTYNCDGYNGACLYTKEGRCVFSIAPIKQETTRACYEDNRKALVEAEHDYSD